MHFHNIIFLFLALYAPPIDTSSNILNKLSFSMPVPEFLSGSKTLNTPLPSYSSKDPRKRRLSEPPNDRYVIWKSYLWYKSAMKINCPDMALVIFICAWYPFMIHMLEYIFKYFIFLVWRHVLSPNYILLCLKTFICKLYLFYMHVRWHSSSGEA